jgi:hypothetical protein
MPSWWSAHPGHEERRGRIRAVQAEPYEQASAYGLVLRPGNMARVDDGALRGMNVTAVVRDPTSPSTLYVGWWFNTDTWTDTRGGVMVSANGGQSWTPLLSGVPVRDLVIEPNEPSSICTAALTGGVLRWVKGVWSNPNVGLPLTTPDRTPMYFNAIEVNPEPRHVGQVLVGTGEGNAPATHGSVYRSFDRANSWTNLVTSSNIHADDTVIVPPFCYLGGTGDAISAVIVPLPTGSRADAVRAGERRELAPQARRR